MVRQTRWLQNIPLFSWRMYRQTDTMVAIYDPLFDAYTDRRTPWSQYIPLFDAYTERRKRWSQYIPFLVQLSRRLLGSHIVCRTSVRPSSLTLYILDSDRKTKMTALVPDRLRHFRLLWKRWTEFHETWQEARSKRPLPHFCFSGGSENKMAARASDWLRHSLLLHWNCWTELKKKLDRKKDLNGKFEID